MKFRILEGCHRLNGVTYKTGETVETELRLDRSFPKRFESISVPKKVEEKENLDDSSPLPKKRRKTSKTQ